jgi:hypothetical protein
VNLADRVPVRAAIRAAAASASFFPIEYAVAVEQPQHKPPACYAYDLLQRLLLVLNEAERGDRGHKIKTRVGKRQVTRIAHIVNFIRATMRLGVIERIAVEIQPGYAQAGVVRESACEITGAATNVEQGRARNRRKHPMQ